MEAQWDRPSHGYGEGEPTLPHRPDRPWSSHRRRAASLSRVTLGLALGATLVTLSPTGAEIRFLDVTAESGVTFRHDPSKTSSKHLIEAMGSGVAMLDFDRDGHLDLYFVNGAAKEGVARGVPLSKEHPRYWNRLYRNSGNGHFCDVTLEAGVAGSGYGMGVATADYDGDGDTDIFVSNFGPDLLFRNEGDGTFLEVAESAGILGPGWSSGAAFFDFNGDGHLDLIVAGYLAWDFELSRPCGESLPERRSYCHPRLFRPAPHTLYQNLGTGRFEDVTAKSGIAEQPGKGLGVAINDSNADGLPDIFIANDSFPQQLFVNAGGGRFRESGLIAGVAYDREGRDFAGMGVVWEDYNGDRLPDLLVNALGRQGYWLFQNTGMEYRTASGESGLLSLSELRSGWGMGLEDFDNDGWRDLIVGQGHVMDDISLSDDALAHKEPVLLARNLHGQFFDVSQRAGPAFLNRWAARGVAIGDVDGDGRVDAAISVNDGPAVVLRNQSSEAAWLSVSLRGRAPNRDAIGARVCVIPENGRAQCAFRGTAGSYLSASSVPLHFGLGATSRLAKVAVDWPDGTRQEVPTPPFGRLSIRQDGPTE